MKHSTVTLYCSSSPGATKIRADQARAVAIMDARKIIYTMVDVFMNKDAKEYMHSKSSHITLPQIFVNGEFKGLINDLEDANEAEGVEAWLET